MILGGEIIHRGIKTMGRTYKYEKSWGRKAPTRSRRQRTIEEESLNDPPTTYDYLESEDDEEQHKPRHKTKNKNNL